LNPGPSPCEGSLNDCWNHYKAQFEEWLSSRVAERTRKDYLNALTRFFGKHKIGDIKHLKDALQKENYNEKIVKGLRNFVNFPFNSFKVLLERPYALDPVG